MQLASVHVVTLILFFIFGLVFGSFGNVVALRLQEHKLPNGRSQCPNCKHTLQVLDLIPLISFLLRAGKCHYCNTPISWRYPTIELLSGILFVLALFVGNFVLIPSVLLAMCYWLLLVIALIDWSVKGIPDILSFPFIVLAIIFSVATGTFDPISVAIGVGFLGIQWLGSGGTWVGAGDIILAIGIGALVGPWPLMIVCIFCAYILGAIIASYLLFSKKRSRKDSLAFGPFLAISTVLTMVIGEQFLLTVYGIAL